ncbi:MAG: universal stress protein [Actinobacteria bacterium]|nr:universal stress protein [Actinomycetota bacterium]
MTVLVGVDGSRNSSVAIRLAQQEAAYRDTSLAAVMAYASDSALGAPAARPLATAVPPEEESQAWESVLRQAVLDALGRIDGVELRAVAGAPGRVLVQEARVLDADLVVLATRKEHAPSRLLGPVSQYVLRNAPCPVLVVPDESKEPDAPAAR